MKHFLYWLTSKLPARSIDGEHGEPYLERYFLFQFLGVQAYIHRFLASDPDRGLHDHPWGWSCSLILVGGYIEIRATEVALADDLTHRVKSCVRCLLSWRLNFIRGTDFHRILLDPGQEAWTLFVHGPRKKDWGFMRNGEYRLAGFKTNYRIKPWWRDAPSGNDLRVTRITGLLAEAATIIADHALALRECSTLDPDHNDWSGEEDALESYKYMKETATRLYLFVEKLRAGSRI